MSLSFICENPECIAKGKVYPVAMDCVMCNTPVTAKIAFTDEQESLLESLPYVIAFPLKRSFLEPNASVQINLFKDTFLNYLKYLGLLCASEFFSSDLRNKNMVSLFQQALAEPSFGTWNMYIRESLKFLEENNHQFFIAELPEYYARVETGKKRKLYKGNIEYIDGQGEVQLKKQEATGIGMLINFRNRFLGHGQTLDENESKALWEEYSPIFFTLLQQMSFCKAYPMLKNEHGSTYKLQTPDIIEVEHEEPFPSKVWIENASGDKIDVVPFFVVPGELAIAKEDKEQLLTYESYTGKTIKFFSPEGSEKQTSGKILERLNLLLREKQSENTFSPSSFTKEVFERQIKEENKLLLNTLVAERKVIPGVYVHRKDIEVRLKEWVGARASILFITAEAGSGKTNLLVEAQRLYQEDGMHSLIIRAGRMEKVTLQEQLAYMLNLEPGRSLGDYEHIAGTQATPTFVLLDGLNEAPNAVNIWNEVLEISGMFTPGSLKFVVTSRSNTNADIERYSLAESQEELLYRDSKSEYTDLKSSAFWLTALNMEEMKEAWLMYGKKDKSRFKPLFSFDGIADVDRGIYEQINNPLILRIFLEIYSGKKLLSKGKKVLNIWEDWFRTFSQDEKSFMQLLATKVWQKGVNELLLDDLLKDKELKDYLVSDALNSPYQRLKNLGWISRFTKDLDIVLGFTVEGLLLYVLARRLEERGKVDVHFIDDIVDEGSPIKKSATEQYLSLEAAKGDISLVTTLIDAEADYTSLCLKPLLNFIQVEGVEAMVNEVLANPTDGDWEILFKLDKELVHLSMKSIRHSIAEKAIDKLTFDNKNGIFYFFRALKLVPRKKGETLFKHFLNTNSELVKLYFHDIGNLYLHFNNLEKAKTIFQDLISQNEGSLKINAQFSLAAVYGRLSNFEQATEVYNEILRNPNLSDVYKSAAYFGLGVNYSRCLDFKNALINYNKTLEIRYRLYGAYHINMWSLYNNISIVLAKQQRYKEALNLLQKAENVIVKCSGSKDYALARIYDNMGRQYQRLNKFEEAEKYIRLSIEIREFMHSQRHQDTGIAYASLGRLKLAMNEPGLALQFFLRAKKEIESSLGEGHLWLGQLELSIAKAYKMLGDHEKELISLEESYRIQSSHLKSDHRILNSISERIIELINSQ